MDVKYTKAQQEVIISVLCALLKADYRTHDAEQQCLQECVKELGFDDDSFEPFPPSQLKLKVLEVLAKMSKEQKKAFSLMMTKIARSDGHFGPLERAFAVEILDLCEIPFVHKEVRGER